MKKFTLLLLVVVSGLVFGTDSSDTGSEFNHAAFAVACSESRPDYNFTTYSHFLSSTEDKKISSIRVNASFIPQQKIAFSYVYKLFTVIDTDSKAFALILEQPFIEFHVSRFFTDRAPPLDIIHS